MVPAENAPDGFDHKAIGANKAVFSASHNEFKSHSWSGIKNFVLSVERIPLARSTRLSGKAYPMRMQFKRLLLDHPAPGSILLSEVPPCYRYDGVRPKCVDHGRLSVRSGNPGHIFDINSTQHLSSTIKCRLADIYQFMSEHQL